MLEQLWIGNVFAAVAATGEASNMLEQLIRPLLMTAIFSVAGVVLLAVCFWIIVKLSPFSVRREIEEDQNVALGIIIGSLIIAIAVIVSAAIHS
jgi:putative membrane protein